LVYGSPNTVVLLFETAPMTSFNRPLIRSLFLETFSWRKLNQQNSKL